MKILKFLFKNVLYGLLFFALTNCYMSSPDPLSTNVSGRWNWTKTFGRDYNVIKAAAPGLSAHIEVRDSPSGSGFLNVVEFYENNVKVDSLYMPDTDNYRSSVEKNNELFVNYVDGKKNPAVVRFKFFFPKKRYSASRMEINIQKNTTSYSPAADTIVTEYLKDPM